MAWGFGIESGTRGSQMENGEQSCPSCMRPVRPGITYCTMCGARLDGAPTASAVPGFVPLQYKPAPPRRRKRRPRDHEWQFWRPRHFSLRR